MPQLILDFVKSLTDDRIRLSCAVVIISPYLSIIDCIHKFLACVDTGIISVNEIGIKHFGQRTNLSGNRCHLGLQLDAIPEIILFTFSNQFLCCLVVHIGICRI